MKEKDRNSDKKFPLKTIVSYRILLSSKCRVISRFIVIYTLKCLFSSFIRFDTYIEALSWS